MLHVILTKHLVYTPCDDYVVDRETFRDSPWVPGRGVVGKLQRGPNLPIDDLNVIDEWRQLQEFQASRR